jgi:hypothetical protein
VPLLRPARPVLVVLRLVLTPKHAVLCAAYKDAACAVLEHPAVFVQWATDCPATRRPANPFALSPTAPYAFLLKDAVFVIVASSCLKLEHVCSCASFQIAKLAQQLSALHALMGFLFLRMAIFATQLAAGTQSHSIIPAYPVLLPSATASPVLLPNQE